MKQLLTAVLLVAATTVSAATQKVAEVQFVGVDGLAKAAAKLAELSGNAMLAPMAVQAINKSAIVEKFGPTRPGAPVIVSVYADDARVVSPTNLEDVAEIAVLYPIVATKAKFLAHNDEAVETNGYICLDGEVSSDPVWARFSDDGKWLALSDKMPRIEQALREAPAPDKSLGGDLVRARLTEYGARLLRKVFEIFAKAPEVKVSPACIERYRTLLAGFTAASFSARLGDRGFDVRVSVKTVDESDLGKIGRTPLAADPLAFADKSALLAVAGAAGSGSASAEIVPLWNAVSEVLRKHKIRTDWLVCESTPGYAKFVLDADALLDYAQASVTNGMFLTTDWKQVNSNLTEALKPFELVGASPTSPAFALSFGLKGRSCAFAPAARFAATLPEAKDKKPFSVGVFSLVSYVRAYLPMIEKALSENDENQLASLKALIPAETAAAIASMSWREGDTIVNQVRVSADEIKGLGKVVTSAASIVMLQMGGGCSDGDADDADDDVGDADGDVGDADDDVGDERGDAGKKSDD